MLLETLNIVECSELKYLIKDEGSYSIEEIVDDKNPNPRSHDSTFQQLKLLHIEGCDQLEFVLPICYCEDLPLLEIMKLSKCNNLRYVFDQYPKEGGLHQMQHENMLRSLKVMSINDVPLFANAYPECYLPQKSTTNTNEGLKEKDKGPSCNFSWNPLSCFLMGSSALQGKYIGNRVHGIFTPPLYPCNLREMNIGDISNLRSLFSISIASSMPLLEELTVGNCDELEHIVIEEVDSHHHMNVSSIFPKLRTIEIKECDKLEYVFPASCSRNLVHLKSVLIQEASELKYVFGKSCDDDNSPHENQNTEIDLSDLNKLFLNKVPNMVSMCHENYYVKALSLQDICLVACPQLPINSFIDLSVEVHKGQEQLSQKKLIGMQLCNLKHLRLGFFDTETIYDLERLQISSPVNLSLDTLHLIGMDKLRNICVGPKNLRLSFKNLVNLYIYKCHQLKFILSASISRSLPYLRILWVSECEELERIIEDDDDDQECCFPNLHMIYVEDCERLKCLFSVSTCGSLPQLSLLYIERAPELEQVFKRKQGTTQELDIKHVFPNLFAIRLEDIPKLHTICPSTDFQAVIYRRVKGCPNISLTSTDVEFFERYVNWLEESESNKGDMDEADLFEQIFNRARE